MTRDDIIYMAHEANLHVIDEEDAAFLEAFAALVREHLLSTEIHSCHADCQRFACVQTRKAVAAEREACAKLCDWRTGYIEVDAALEVSGAAIRARGQ